MIVLISVDLNYKLFCENRQEMEKKGNETGASPKVTSTYAQFKDEKEKKAAILAKYGFKQRDFDGVDDMSSSSSSSDSSDDDDYELDENNIPKHIARRYSFNNYHDFSRKW